MRKVATNKPVERLFPFALRSGILIIGRENLQRRRKKLLFVLITNDLSENSREQIVRDFSGSPIITRYSAAEIERLFGFKNTKVLGFAKSPLANSIYGEMRNAEAKRQSSETEARPGPLDSAEAAESKRSESEPDGPSSPAGGKPGSSDEQMEHFEQQLKEDDWGHQPC